MAGPQAPHQLNPALTSTESMLLSLLSVPSFTTYCDTSVGRCTKKEPNLTDRSDVIFEVPKCSKILISPGSAPDPSDGADRERLHCSPDLAGSEGTLGPLRNNPTPDLALSIRPRFCTGFWV